MTVKLGDLQILRLVVVIEKGIVALSAPNANSVIGFRPWFCSCFFLVDILFFLGNQFTNFIPIDSVISLSEVHLSSTLYGVIVFNGNENWL